MVIGVAGKKGHGKDEVGIIIQYLTNPRIISNPNARISDASFLSYVSYERWKESEAKKAVHTNSFKVVKFADCLKDMVCILLNCTREELEDPEFKEKELEEQWWYYKTGDTILPRYYYPNDKDNKMCEERYLVKPTPRLFLQLLGTECGRQIIHPNIWLNATFNKYRPTLNWAITDVRFPNEYNSIVSRGGFVIRVQRYPEYIMRSTVEHKEPFKVPFDRNNQQHLQLYQGEQARAHESETALDNIFLDEYIDNNGTLQNLVDSVREILIKRQVL